jgi:hypothetical protein
VAIHGAEREAQRRRDYQRTEMISLGEAIRTAEAKLNDVSRRLEYLERILTEQHGSVHSGANTDVEE